MSRRVVTEEELRERLRKAGRPNREIETLIDEYAAASGSDYPDEKAISQILQKTQQDSMLRVKSFALTREQYDALLGHYRDVGVVAEGSQADAGLLVRKALKDIVDLIS